MHNQKFKQSEILFLKIWMRKYYELIGVNEILKKQNIKREAKSMPFNIRKPKHWGRGCDIRSESEGNKK